MPEHSQIGRYEYSMQSGFQHDDHQLLHVPHSRHDACKASILHRGESSQPEHIHMYTMLQYIIKLLLYKLHTGLQRSWQMPNTNFSESYNTDSKW